MILQILRGAFVLLVASVTALYVLPYQVEKRLGFTETALMLGAAIAVALLIVAIDAGTRHKRLSAMSGVFLGLIAGLVAAYALSFPLGLIGLIFAPDKTADAEAFLNLMQGVYVLVGIVTCYLGISLVLQTKDDFRFVIPYVEFAKQIRGNRPTLLDTSVIVDGRILDVIETRVMQGVMIVPRFVLNELQTIADSSDKLKRARGRRGLDVLKKLQDSPLIEVHLEDRDAEGGNVDQKLISLAHELQARVMTNDYNLNKVATLRGVDVINMNDLAKALRPVVLPGEHMTVKIVKPGESPTQGVGYLDDGTMVVVEGARRHMHETIDLSVTSTLQTSAGRMIFGKYEGGGDSGSRPTEPGDQRSDPPTAAPADAGKPQPSSRPRTTAARRNPRRG
ncbi:MAG: TRAM domain-containing protein [Planctomycetes bacterium]|nr:TRAM domain-containing protein [Planctomycetota bacterium]